MEVVKKRKSIVWIAWIIPLVTLIITGIMLYDHYAKIGMKITVTLDNVDSLHGKRARIVYSGITVGYVSSIRLDDQNIRKFLVEAEIETEYTYLFKKGTRIWKVDPKVSLQGASNLDTVLTGSYLRILPPFDHKEKLSSLPFEVRYTALENPPVEGVKITLFSQTGDLSIGAPLLFKSIKIGEIISKDLTKEGILYTLNVEKKYRSYISSVSRFYLHTPLKIDASLKGLSLSLAPLNTLLNGGIEVITPKQDDNIQSRYVLHEKRAKKEKSGYEVRFVTDIPLSGYIMYKGTQVGELFESRLVGKKLHTKGIIYTPYKALINDSTLFYKNSLSLNASLKGIKVTIPTLKESIEGGISFLTPKESPLTKKQFALFENKEALENHLFIASSRLIHLKSQTNDLSIDTPLLFKGEEIGKITAVSLKKNGVLYDLRIKNAYASFINDSTLFYKTTFSLEASLKGISVTIPSLGSLEGGLQCITPDKSALVKKSLFSYFETQNALKKSLYQNKGAFLSLLSNTPSLKIGMPIRYKGFTIGEVTDQSLEGERVRYTLFIEKKHLSLINASTRFYTQSALSLKASFSGVSVDIASLKEAYEGSLTFITPKKAPFSERFTLTTKEEIEAEESFTLTLISETNQNLSSLSSLYYKGVSLANVEKISLKNGKVHTTLRIPKEYKTLFGEGAKIYSEGVKLDKSGLKNLSSAVTGNRLILVADQKGDFQNRFTLQKEPKKEGLRVTLYAQSKGGLSLKSPLYYRKVAIGEVEEISLSEDGRSVLITLFLEEKYRRFIRKNSKFFHAGVIGVEASLLSVKVKTGTIESMLLGGVEVVTPDDAETQAEPKSRFKLYDEPEEEWLKWRPYL